MLLGVQAVKRSFSAPGTFFREDIIGLENISMAILPLLLIQEESVSGKLERMYSKYW